MHNIEAAIEMFKTKIDVVYFAPGVLLFPKSERSVN